jgi:predicted CopG family antitoxin
MAKKTTVTLRDDVYQTLKEKAGARNISSQINKILIEHFAKTESMFGVMKQTDTANLRNHKDRRL